MSERTVVIVGAGLAGARTAEKLRAGGHTGAIVLVGAEEHLPYERPPLSKSYLAGTADRASLDVHDRRWYRDHDVTLRLVSADDERVIYDLNSSDYDGWLRIVLGSSATRGCRVSNSNHLGNGIYVAKAQEIRRVCRDMGDTSAELWPDGSDSRWPASIRQPSVRRRGARARTALIRRTAAC